MPDNRCILVDLDSTLAVYDPELDRHKPNTYVGPPIPKMVERVKDKLNQGEIVKLFTARKSTLTPEAEKAIDDWCEQNLGQKLEIINEKTHEAKEIWDNIARQVVDNTGEFKDEMLLLEVAELVKKHLDEHKELCNKNGGCKLYQEIRMMAELLESE